MQKQEGLTMVELMTVIGIIAILASIAVPSLIGWFPNHRLGSASRDILSVLQMTRLRAVKENADVTVQFDVGNENYTVFIDNGAGAGTPADGVQNGAERTLKSETMPAGVDLVTTTFGSHRVLFNSRGMPNITIAGNVSVQNSQSTVRQIIVNPTGNSRINIP